MWPKEYKDYREDDPLVKEQVEPGKGIIGCEMHDVNGWNETLHSPIRRKKPGIFRLVLSWLFGERS